MSEFARFATIILISVALFACGWFGRGWWDGSTIKITDSAKQAQTFVDAATKATTAIVSSEGKATAQRERTRARIDHAEAVTSCPAGTGAVSADVEQRLRTAFGPAKG